MVFMYMSPGIRESQDLHVSLLRIVGKGEERMKKINGAHCSHIIVVTLIS